MLMQTATLERILATIVLMSCSGDDSEIVGPPAGAADEESALQALDTETLMAQLQDLPVRVGPLPERTFDVPHLQLTQGGVPELGDQLIEAIDRLEGMSIEPVRLQRQDGSLYDGRGWQLAMGLGGGPDADKFDGFQFGHLHHPESGSMHVFLPRDIFREIAHERGWAELHPFSAAKGFGTPTVDLAMIWGPRTPEELQVAWLLVRAAYAHATGLLVP